jgi:cysteine desulfurase family protein (TIGR01976 family)
MTTLDLNFIRSQFPAFSEPTLEGFAHFENAGGSYACGQTIEHLQRFYIETKVQSHHDFAPSRRAGELMDRARDRMAAWLNVGVDEVHFGPSTSQNTYVLAQALRQHLQPGDEFIVTNQDHEANIGVWRKLEAHGIVIREWQIDPETGELDPADLDGLLNERTRVVAFTHCSNIVGSVHPVREITDKIHAAGAMAIVDGVSYCPHGLPDVSDLGADIYLISLYKVYGPHLGVMFMRKQLNDELPTQGHFFNVGHVTARFTPAGPDHAQVAAVNGVMDYLHLVHDHHTGEPGVLDHLKARHVLELFQQQERSLLQPLLDFLVQHPETRLIGRNTVENRAPTVAFTVSGKSSSEIGKQLGERKLGVGVGHFYAYRAIEALGIPTTQGWVSGSHVHKTDGVVRASYVHYTSEEEVTRLIETLDSLL